MINAGNSTSQAIIETKIDGEGSIYTYVETEVNGQKQVFETTDPGRYEIKLESSSLPSPVPTPTFTPATIVSPSPPKPQLLQIRLNWKTLINQICQNVVSFLSGLF
jgi:hypothetical protein